MLLKASIPMGKCYEKPPFLMGLLVSCQSDIKKLRGKEIRSTFTSIRRAKKTQIKFQLPIVRLLK